MCEHAQTYSVEAYASVMIREYPWPALRRAEVIMTPLHWNILSSQWITPSTTPSIHRIQEGVIQAPERRQPSIRQVQCCTVLRCLHMVLLFHICSWHAEQGYVSGPTFIVAFHVTLIVSLVHERTPYPLLRRYKPSTFLMEYPLHELM